MKRRGESPEELAVSEYPITAERIAHLSYWERCILAELLGVEEYQLPTFESEGINWWVNECHEHDRNEKRKKEECC